jgi:mono/diheme cytochrome c family protein
MSRIIGLPGLTRGRVLLLTAFWLVPVEFPLFTPSPGPARPVAAQDFPPQFPGAQDVPNQDPFGQFPSDEPEYRPRASRSAKARAARRKARAAEKGATKKADAKAKTKTKSAETETKAADSGQFKFAQDIAPILVANCVGCHRPGEAGQQKGKLDLTTFANLQKGTPDHKVIVPGKPEDSHLVLRIKGEETPRMPRGGNRVLSDEAIAKIEQWVKAGARLEAAVDPKAALESYASTPEQVRRNVLAKQSPKERDQQVEAEGLKRWKQANAKLKPEVVTGAHFILFSNLPKDRATSTLKSLEPQYTHLKRFLGSAAPEWGEKVSLYVFNGKADFIEFVRSVESRDPDPDVTSSAKLGIPQPYIAAVDPAGGKREEPIVRRRAKGKRGEDKDKESSTGPDRTLLGVLTEALGSGAVAAAGNPPRWLREGIGTFMAAQVEPRSPYYQQLRRTALSNYQQGWQTKANEAFGEGNQITAADLHAIGFALVEAMMKTELRAGFPAFVHGLLQGATKLDEMLEKVYEGAKRDDFLTDTGEWIATNYGQLQ